MSHPSDTSLSTSSGSCRSKNSDEVAFARRLRPTCQILADDLFGVYLATYERAWSLFPGVLPCFACLREHKLGIVSNGNAAQQREKLLRLGRLDRLACVILSEEYGVAKPDPRIFLRACELGATAPCDAVHVGDRLDVDVQGASRAGLQAVWLNRNGRTAPSPERAVRTIESLTDLPGILLVHPIGAG